MCVGVASSGLLHSGYNVNMLDIAPGYACIIMGLCNTLGTTAGFLSPMLVGYLTANKVQYLQNMRILQINIIKKGKPINQYVDQFINELTNQPTTMYQTTNQSFNQ